MPVTNPDSEEKIVLTRKELQDLIDERLRTGRFKVVDAGLHKMYKKAEPTPTPYAVVKKHQKLFGAAVGLGFMIAWELRKLLVDRTPK